MRRLALGRLRRPRASEPVRLRWTRGRSPEGGGLGGAGASPRKVGACRRSRRTAYPPIRAAPAREPVTSPTGATPTRSRSTTSRAQRASRGRTSASEFRRAFGESPHAYLLTRRLERAAALLRTTDRSRRRRSASRRPAQRRVVHDELHPRVRGLRRRATAWRSRRPLPTPACRRASSAAYGRPRHRTFREDGAADRL